MKGVTTEQLKSIVALAARAPSGDNTQPWKFAWDGRVLTVLFDPAKARHVLDAGFSAAKISLGCVLESIAIAASRFGFVIDSEILELRQEPQGAAARISFLADGRGPDALLDAIPKRTTDRRLFQKGKMPGEDLRQVWDKFGQRDVAQVHYVEAIPGDVIDYIISAENLVAIHPAIFPDTLQWVRFSEGEIERTEDGMPWRGAGIDFFQYPILRLVRAVPAAFPLVSRAGMKQIYAMRVKQLLQSSAGLFCVSVREQGPSVLVDAGRLAMRLWLRLTQLGYGVQPLTISSLSIYNAEIGVLDEDSRRLFGARYAEGERILRRAFAIPDDSMPVWMFRTGRSSPLPAAWLTRRKGLETALQFTHE